MISTIPIPQFNQQPVTLIEIDDSGHLRQIWTDKHQCVTAWSKKCGVYLVDTFNGGEQVRHQYWVNRAQNVETHPDAVRLSTLPIEVQGWIDGALEIDRHPLYCKVCDDYLPSDPDYECDHLWWVKPWGWYGGCGYAEHSSLDDRYRASVFAYFDLSGYPTVRALREALRSHSYLIAADQNPVAFCPVSYWSNHRSPHDCETRPVRFGRDWWAGGDELDTNDDLIAPASAWFKSLEAGITTEADLVTVRWIDEWLEAFPEKVVPLNETQGQG